MEYATADLPAADFPEEPVGSDVYRIVPRTVVPDLNGLDIEEVVVAIYGAGLRLDRRDADSPLPAGQIISVVPRAGTALRQGATVSVVVSTGQRAPALVPDLVGIPLGDVAAALNALRDNNDVQVTWTIEYVVVSDGSKWGHVVATDPAPGSVIADGATIKVIVGQQPSG